MVLFFLRRFGCQICRWIASEVSKLEADLRAGGVALVGIAPEELGLKEFKEGGFFKGCKQYLYSSRMFSRPVGIVKSFRFVELRPSV